MLPSPEHLERDFEHHVLAFSRQGGPKSHCRSLMVFGDVLIYLTELADKLGINPVEAVKAKMAMNGQRYPAELVKGRAAKYAEFR